MLARVDRRDRFADADVAEEGEGRAGGGSEAEEGRGETRSVGSGGLTMERPMWPVAPKTWVIFRVCNVCWKYRGGWRLTTQTRF